MSTSQGLVFVPVHPLLRSRGAPLAGMKFRALVGQAAFLVNEGCVHDAPGSENLSEPRPLGAAYLFGLLGYRTAYGRGGRKGDECHDPGASAGFGSNLESAAQQLNALAERDQSKPMVCSNMICPGPGWIEAATSVADHDLQSGVGSAERDGHPLGLSMLGDVMERLLNHAIQAQRNSR